MSPGQQRAGSNLQSLNRVQQQIVAKAIHPAHGVNDEPSCIGLQTYAAFNSKSPTCPVKPSLDIKTRCLEEAVPLGWLPHAV